MPDFAINRMLESSSVDGTTGNLSPTISVGCTACKSKLSEAVARCYDCTNHLCGQCMSAHQSMHCFAGHRVALLADTHQQNGGGDKQVTCPKHHGEVLRFFCKQCDVPICKECTLQEHSRGHDYDYLSEMSGRAMIHVHMLAEQARQRSAYLKTVANGIGSAMTALPQQHQKAIEKVEEAHAAFLAALEDRKAEVLKELETVFCTKNEQAGPVSSNTKSVINDLDNGVAFIDKMLKHAGSMELLLFKNVLTERLQTAIGYLPEVTPADVRIDYVFNMQSVQAAVRNTFGYVLQCVTRNEPTPPVLKMAPISRPNGSPTSQLMNGMNGIYGSGHLNGSASPMLNGYSGSSSNGYSSPSTGGYGSSFGDVTLPNCHSDLNTNHSSALINGFGSVTPLSANILSDTIQEYRGNALNNGFSANNNGYSSNMFEDNLGYVQQVCNGNSNQTSNSFNGVNSALAMNTFNGNLLNQNSGSVFDNNSFSILDPKLTSIGSALSGITDGSQLPNLNGYEKWSTGNTVDCLQLANLDIMALGTDPVTELTSKVNFVVCMLPLTFIFTIR